MGRKVVVTGASGFIGSHLCERLVANGDEVVGVDCFTDYYARATKERNVAPLRDARGFRLVEGDLAAMDLAPVLADASIVYHLAAQAGVRASWGDTFAEYLGRNVMATQRLLEACRRSEVKDTLVRFVYSSSSSVYGDQEQLPVTEQALPQPRSPYGVTKMAAEHLCVLYSANFSVPTSSLRYFTVYGPRQRPDMAFRKYIEAALDGRVFQVYGDGQQTRDFTYVGDAVRSNLLAVACDRPWEVFNTGGGSNVVFADALALLGNLLRERVPGVTATVEYRPTADGDVRDTFAERTYVEKTIGYRPTIAFEEGLRREVAWAVARRRSA